MSCFSAIVIAALLATTSASPLQVRTSCGTTPSGSGNAAAIKTVSGITTASDCQSQCNADSSCQSFVFGMVNNQDECSLYSVSASQVPKQSSDNLLVYDKSCTSVSTTTPTSQIPTEKSQRLTTRDTCGVTPSATETQTPLSEPSATTAADCQDQCDANSSCESFVFGMVDDVDECILYSVPGSEVPTQSSSNLVVYDKSCTSVSNVDPVSSNPTGSSTGSSGTGSTGSASTGSTGVGSTGTGSTPGNTGSNSGAGSNTGATTGPQGQ